MKKALLLWIIVLACFSVAATEPAAEKTPREATSSKSLKQTFPLDTQNTPAMKVKADSAAPASVWPGDSATPGPKKPAWENTPEWQQAQQMLDDLRAMTPDDPRYYRHGVPVNRCLTMVHDAFRRAMNPRLGSLDDFENWVDEKIRELPQRDFSGVITIPVVVHIIHNGEAEGTGRNISDAQVISQINVLNEDYRRMAGTPGYNTNPVGADTEIEFCLAQRDPSGNPTDGIIRWNRNTYGWSGPSYTYNPTGPIETTIKPATIWDPTQYLNMWTVDFSDGTLGYAQFPDDTGLSGLDCDGGDASTDGLVMAYDAFGDNDPTGTFPDMSPPYDLGRTATHEIGHGFGLRHIWGDGNNCTADDYCNDTPNSNNELFNCPSTNTCTDPDGDPPDMPENYMSYADDDCMNIYTQDQKRRMRAVFMNSPRRLELLNSPGCIPPDNDDAGITSIITPVRGNCSATITPRVELKNFGLNTLSAVQIHFLVDGSEPPASPYSWSGSLSANATAFVDLPAITVSSGAHTFDAYTTLPNGVSDTYGGNNAANQTDFSYNDGNSLPFTEDFEDFFFPPDGWWVNDPDDDCYFWTGQSATGSDGNPSDMAFVNCYAYDPANSQLDELISPVIALEPIATTLEFDVAYARYNASYYEALEVLISTNCGSSWTSIYNKSGSTLATVGDQAADWYPAAAGDWRRESVSLATYVNQNINVKFVSTNGFGNNLFIDNVSIPSMKPQISFVTTTTATSEGIRVDGSVDCLDYHEITLTMQISGMPTGDATVNFSTAGTATENVDYFVPASVTFPSGSSANQTVTIRVYDEAAVESSEDFTLSYTISGATDAIAGLTNQTHVVTINDNDIAPTVGTVTLFSEDFESGAATGWSAGSFIDPAGLNVWVVGTAAGFAGSTYSAYITRDPDPGTQPFRYNRTSVSDAGLFTPVIDATGLSDLTLEFDFKCDGEVNYDYGLLLYSNTPPYNIFSLLDGSSSAPYVNQGSTTVTRTLNLPAVLEDTAFVLCWNWMNDGSIKSDPPFGIDNITLTYENNVEIESTINSAQTHYLGPHDTVFYTDASTGRLMAKIENLRDHDYGCTTVTIDRAGTSAVAFWNPDAGDATKFLASKSFLVTPTNNNPGGSYTITLYYTEAEVAGWETDTGNDRSVLKVAKTGGPINNITPSTPEANGATNYLASTCPQGTFGSDFYISATFSTGFSGFGVGDPGAPPTNTIFDSFTATPGDQQIRLDWVTASEVGTIGFMIERQVGDGEYETISGLIVAAGNAFNGAHYSFEDHDVESGTPYWYRLSVYAFNGGIDYFGPVNGIIELVGVETDIPTEFGLAQNFPNPFNPATSIYYQLPQREQVSIQIYNQTGQLVRILVDDVLEPGYYEAVWDTRNENNRPVASGIYFYRMEAGEFSAQKRMTLLR